MANHVAPSPEELEDRIGLLVHEFIRRSGHVESPVCTREDLYQAALVRLISKLHLYDPEKGAFTTWAALWIREAIQKEQQRVSWKRWYVGEPIPGRAIISMDVSHDPDDDSAVTLSTEVARKGATEDDQSYVWADEFLATMPEGLDRQVALGLLQEKSMTAMAREYRTSLDTIKHHVARVQARLRHYLDLEGEL